VTRLAPPLVLVLVTALLLNYGRSSWSWVAGPVAALLLWSLELKAREPAAPAVARRPSAPTARRAPTPVD
jgi:hypothetical protein